MIRWVIPLRRPRKYFPSRVGRPSLSLKGSESSHASKKGAGCGPKESKSASVTPYEPYERLPVLETLYVNCQVKRSFSPNLLPKSTPKQRKLDFPRRIYPSFPKICLYRPCPGNDYAVSCKDLRPRSGKKAKRVFWRMQFSISVSIQQECCGNGEVLLPQR